MEYGHEHAVADGVNVGYDVYKIDTEITARAVASRKVSMSINATASRAKSAGNSSTKTLLMQPNELDRAVVAPDQIRTVIRTFRDRSSPKSFPAARRSEDTHLRQGRLTRRRHRQHRARRVR